MKTIARKKPAATWSRKLPVSRLTADELTLRLYRHVLLFWGENCQALSVEARSRFFYIGATLREDPPQLDRKKKRKNLLLHPTSFKLCRIEYLGTADKWGFSFYKYSDEKYERSLFPSGDFEGTPEEAFDCAARVYLTGL